MTNDRIEKKVLLRAAPARVWDAIADSRQFGVWFGARFAGPFVEGQVVKGSMVPTQVDAAVAAQQKAFEGMAFDVQVERVEPPRHLSFRWLPGADPDTSADAPTTLVAFDLEPAEGGTLLTITESGFENIPLEQRAKAFADNEGGWEIQGTLIAKYLDAA